MILKGNQRSGGAELAAHLMNLRDNDHVTVHELRGFVAGSLGGAFKEVQAVSRGTKCKQYLFSLSLNPPETADVPVDAFEKAIAAIERKLGLIDQPRAIIFHEKNGRRHAHCVWSRIDAAEMKAINLPHYKMKLRDISRDLYLEHRWQLPPGLADPSDRDPLNFSREEWQQALRVETDPKMLKQVFIDCWQASDNRAAFEMALRGHGQYLAKGDRRGYVAVDGHGEIYSLSRWIGKKTKELKARLGPAENLRSIAETRQLIARQLAATAQEVKFAAQKRQAALKACKKGLRDELVERQRLERLQFTERQDMRALGERRQRQARMPTGLKALWLRITGAYKALQKEIEREAATCQKRDRLEMAALVARQLQERRDLKLRLRRQNQSLAGELEGLFADIEARRYALEDAQSTDSRSKPKRRRPPRRPRDT